ncbi:GDP-mannose 4,6-dehydratase [bacterium]|nr:GDP-mannose 4,6-dehydratase [bacterium]
MKKRVLVTGIAGFVGSNLLPKLLQNDYYVIGIDNLSQGLKRNIEPYLSNKNFEFHEIDVRDLYPLKQAAKDITGIIHLAAFKIPRYGNAMDTLKINSIGTEHCLEIAKDIPGCKVLFSSTSDVYGKNPDVPFNEESALVVGETKIKRWSYAVSKIFDEHLCYAYNEKYNVPIVIVRYFGGYGPNQNMTWWGGPQSVFINSILEGKPIDIHGNGLQTRTFTYVSDLVNGTFQAFESKNGVGEVFNIGNEKEITILDLAKILWKIADKKGEPDINFIPYSSFNGKYEDVMRRVPNIEKAKKLIGFKPEVDLEDGLKITFNWQKNQKK